MPSAAGVVSLRGIGAGERGKRLALATLMGQAKRFLNVAAQILTVNCSKTRGAAADCNRLWVSHVAHSASHVDEVDALRVERRDQGEPCER